MNRIIKKLNTLSLPATVVIASIVLGGFYFASQLSKQNSIEKQQQIELQAKKDQEVAASLDAQQKQDQAELLQKQQVAATVAVDKCITDAYAELKTREDNLDRLYLHSCSISLTSTGCDSGWVSNTKKDWLATYQNEWVTQCKLGNRVFNHTEPFYP